MIKKQSRASARVKRHKRVTKNMVGTSERPRLAVFRSNKHIYVQAIDDTLGVTIASASTMEKAVTESLDKTSNVEAATAVGKAIGERLIAKDVTQAIFDRGGYLYHGKVKALADAAREAGVKI